MIIGHQCIISPQGPSKTNLSGCPAYTQMVAGRSCTGTSLFKVKGLGPGIGLIYIEIAGIFDVLGCLCKAQLYNKASFFSGAIRTLRGQEMQ